MDYKNFSIKISNDIDHKDYDQHLKQLDNMLAQFQDEHFEWCLDYYNSCFWLNLNYKNNGDQRQGYKKWDNDQMSPIVRIVIKNTNGIDSLNKLLNIKYFQSALDIMKTLVTYKDPQYDEDFIVKFNLDDNKLSYVNRDWDNREFKFPLDDFSIFPTLIINAIDFVRNLHNNRNNQNINC